MKIVALCLIHDLAGTFKPGDELVGVPEKRLKYYLTTRGWGDQMKAVEVPEGAEVTVVGGSIKMRDLKTDTLRGKTTVPQVVITPKAEPRAIPASSPPEPELDPPQPVITSGSQIAGDRGPILESEFPVGGETSESEPTPMPYSRRGRRKAEDP